MNKQSSKDTEIMENDEKYRILFDSIDQGFCIIELIFNSDNTATDWRFLEVNPAFEKQNGLHDATGKTIRELVPEIEKHWFEIYSKVALTGQSIRFIEASEVMGRWFDVYAFKVGGDNSRKIAVLFTDITKQKKSEEALKIQTKATQNERQTLHNFFMQAPAAFCILQGPEHIFEFANPDYLQLVGNRDVIGKTVREALPEIKGQGFFELLDKVFTTGEAFVGNEVEAMIDKGNGPEQTYIDFTYQPFKNVDGRIQGILVFAYDITKYVAALKNQEEYNQILEMITSGKPLSEALEFLVYSIQRQSTHKMKASVLILDDEGKHLLHGAAPSLPPKYNEAIHGITIGQGVGSCGTAAFLKEPVIVSNISTDPLWKDFKDLAMSHELMACWSQPIISSKGELLGTFALYYHEPLSPSEHDRQIIQFASRTASLIIERSKAEKKIKDSEQRYRFVAESMPQKVWTADVNGNRTYFNHHWVDYTGRSLDELKGTGWIEVVHPDDLPENLRLWQHSIDTGEDFQFENRLRDRDGIYRWHLTRGVAHKDEAGNITMWVGTNTDIHEQKILLEQLQEAYNDLELKVKFRNLELERLNKENLQRIEDLERQLLK